jgi:hypothetical protein
MRACTSGYDFTGHEVGEAEVDERGQPAPGGWLIHWFYVCATIDLVEQKGAYMKNDVCATRQPSAGTAPFFACHLNPVRAGLVSRSEDWSRTAGSSYNEYAGVSGDEQKERCGFIVERVRIPSDPQARI